MSENLKRIGSLPNDKQVIADKFYKLFISEYADVRGEMYLGYPIYHDEVSNQKISVDIALITKIGVYIINILDKAVTDYGQLQDEIFSKVDSKFRKNASLIKRKKLAFDFQVITYCSESMEKQEDYLLANSVEQLNNFIREFHEKEEFTDALYERIISGIQEAYGINNNPMRDGITPGTKADSINKMASLVDRYASSQMEAIISEVDGIQRIRGMAGSGKTIVLARKAVELHTAHPDWDIVVTYSTRSLKQHLEKMISRFYAVKNDGAKYNSNKLKIMHSWGSAYSHGVYYEICLKHGIVPLSFTEAKNKYGRAKDLFSMMCDDILKEIESFKKMYDCILIDEAQDFGSSFLKLCASILGSDQRMVYAYDELQSLNEASMPAPNEIFGRDVDLDTPLYVCYRNQGPVIVTAHALGMGLYRKEGLVQLPGSFDVWKAIGYVSEEPIQEGKEAILYRTKETSPDFLNVDPNEVITFDKCEDANDMNNRLLESIKIDIVIDQLKPSDIMIIDLDTLSYQDNFFELQTLLFNDDKKFSAKDFKYPLSFHIAGASDPEDFFRTNSIVYSGVRRAKGNESFMVYIVNAQKCVNTIQRRADRNALFTAITRSKGWVRVFGFGEDMDLLCDEFNRIREHDFKLYFEHYPTHEELEKIYLNNQDVDSSDKRVFDKTRALISRLTQDGNMTKVQLMKQLFDADTKDLLKMIQDSENGKQE